MSTRRSSRSYSNVFPPQDGIYCGTRKYYWIRNVLREPFLQSIEKAEVAQWNALVSNLWRLAVAGAHIKLYHLSPTAKNKPG